MTLIVGQNVQRPEVLRRVCIFLFRVANRVVGRDVSEVIESLRLLNFRCFEEVSLSLAPEGGIFVGENAQGENFSSGGGLSAFAPAIATSPSDEAVDP